MFISIFSVLSIIIPETEYIILNDRLIGVSKRVFNLFKGVDTIHFSEIDKLEYLPEESTSTIIILTTGLGGVYSQAKIKVNFKSGGNRIIRARGSQKTIIELCSKVNELIAGND